MIPPVGRQTRSDAVSLGTAPRLNRCGFSLVRLFEENPGLADYYHWRQNPAIPRTERWLHLGCGARVFEDFVNLDVVPRDPRIIRWNLLDPWPDDPRGSVEGVFSEDCFEHFFHAEQIYILCNVNRALQSSGVVRLLMPSLAKLIGQYPEYRPGPHDYLTTHFGVATPADAVNYAMRFTGHRWLPDSASIAHMATLCGFVATETDCAHSRTAKFTGLNLRDESNGSLSFAHDLQKTRSVSRIVLAPATVTGAVTIEDLPYDAGLFVSTTPSPTVEYRLPQSLPSDAIVCVNFRSANLSCFDWGVKRCTFGDTAGARPWVFDETLKSQPCMNLITQAQVHVALGEAAEISRLVFSPAHAAGEYFSLGAAEVFVLQ